MNVINSAVRLLPISSNYLRNSTVLIASVTVASFLASENFYLKWGFALTTATLAGATAVKGQQEKENTQKPSPQPLTKTILNAVEECIESEKNPFSADVRAKMKQIIAQLNERGVYIQEGNDDFRAPFVGLQGAFEHVLAAQKTLGTVSHLIGAIHTPQPPTPLCASVDGKNIDSLIAPSLRHDQDKLNTITERALSIRRMLAQEGVVLFAVYPKGGLQKRKEPEQQIFLEEVKNSQGRLIQAELSCDTIDPTRVGAIYIFEDEEGNNFAFSIKAQQANSPQEKSSWGIWFGANDEIDRHVQEIARYILSNNGPDLLRVYPSKHAMQKIGYQSRSFASKREELDAS